MSPASRYYEELLCRLARVSPLLLLGGMAVLALSYLPLRGAVAPSSTVQQCVRVWPDPVLFANADWSVFHNKAGAATGVHGSLAGRYRLAGTFFEFGGVADRQKAILHDLKQSLQHIVSENDALDDVHVVKIFRDRVVLRVGGEEEELWLEFARRADDSTATASHGSGAAEEATGWLGGKQVGEGRWVFQRKALLDYYTELMNSPERLVAVFDSLKPLYNDRGGIDGYYLGVEGEARFFETVGLKEGDIIRKVNSMDMTSRRRAEYFIGEFIGDRANAFVLDIERGPDRQKLIYEVR